MSEESSIKYGPVQVSCRVPLRKTCKVDLNLGSWFCGNQFRDPTANAGISVSRCGSDNIESDKAA